MEKIHEDSLLIGLRDTMAQTCSSVGDFEKCQSFPRASDVFCTFSIEVQRALESIGRSEEIQFSPDNRQLAVAGFFENCILVIDVERRDLNDRVHIHFESATRFSSRTLNQPHGLFWIDSTTLVVANRQGEVCLFKLPAIGEKNAIIDIEPIASLRCDKIDGLHTPGSVVAYSIGNDQFELLVCNNFSNIVTSHIISYSQRITIESSMPLLEHGLLIPDGVAVDRSRNWLAVSNHSDHSVFIYLNDEDLCPTSRPYGTLRGMLYPHGLRFSADGKTILVADAGAPFVYVYAISSLDWRGDHYPVTRLRVLDDEAYTRGRINPQEGGPKGIDISVDGRILVATCEEKPFVCLDIGGLRLPDSVAGAQVASDVEGLAGVRAFSRHQSFKNRGQKLPDPTKTAGEPRSVLDGRLSPLPDPEGRDAAWWNLPRGVTWQDAYSGWTHPRFLVFDPGRYDYLSPHFSVQPGATVRIRTRIWNNGIPAFVGHFQPLIHIPMVQWFSLQHGNSIDPDITSSCIHAIIAAGDTLDLDFLFTNPTGVREDANRKWQLRFKGAWTGSPVIMAIEVQVDPAMT